LLKERIIRQRGWTRAEPLKISTFSQAQNCIHVSTSTSSWKFVLTMLSAPVCSAAMRCGLSLGQSNCNIKVHYTYYDVWICKALQISTQPNPLTAVCSMQHKYSCLELKHVKTKQAKIYLQRICYTQCVYCAAASKSFISNLLNWSKSCVQWVIWCRNEWIQKKRSDYFRHILCWCYTVCETTASVFEQ